MAILGEDGRLLGRINVLDFTLVAVGLAVALGVLLVQSGLHRTSGQMVEGETDIEYTILLKNVKTFQSDLFRKGNQVSLTIRNQPRGHVTLLDVHTEPKQKAIPKADGTFLLVDDPEDPYGYNYTLKLRDHAVVTGDGYVTNGIKVKVGMPMEIEGMLFRLPGVIADIRPIASAG